MRNALRSHWPEYLIEAALLGLFMVSAAVFAVLLEHPASPVRHAIGSPLLRRILMGCAMGATAIAMIYSPWGRRSGAHFNPAVTLTFLRLKKIAGWDAAFYVAAQFIGGLAGIYAIGAVLGARLADPAVHYVATLPAAGIAAAFSAEWLMSFGIMAAVLIVGNHPTLRTRTGLCCGALVALYITVFAPISGMSINPARSFASAMPAGEWPVLWLYFAAPVLGMLSAAEAYTRTAGLGKVYCAKLHHTEDHDCIFRCRFCELKKLARRSASGGPAHETVSNSNLGAAGRP